MKNLNNFSIATLLCLALIAATVGGHDYIPGQKQTQPILLVGGDIYTVANGVMKESDILFIDGRITAIDKQITPPPGAKIVDVTGQRVYPGIIAPNTQLGLIEIGAVRATNDRDERGNNNAEVQAHIAYNPDSEIIPTVRSNGITTALIVPSGSVIRGRSSLIHLDGWTKEDAMAKLNAGLHLSWPRVSVITAWWMDKSADEQKKENEENRRELEETFEKAKSYYIARKANPDLPVDSRWEAMVPVFDKTLPVFIHADDMRQIEQAVDFSKKYDLKMVLVEGRESWKAAGLLKENNIPVILERTQQNPMRTDDPYDLSYTIPKKLQDAGVKYCIAQSSSWSTRNLPFQAGEAAAYGLTKEQALRAITLSTAEIFGVEKELGSLEVGKSATLIVSEGDIMDQLTNQVTHMYIDGREVDLDNKHKELFRKYKEKILRTSQVKTATK